MIRTFICIELSESIKTNLAAVINEVKQYRSVKWVKPENIHLTLKFLGDIEPKRISDIAAAVKLAVEKILPFQIELAQFGAFPNFNRPRVYWIGLEDSSNNLFRLQAAIEQALAQIGFSQEERRFSPHLTLGRSKFQDDSKELAAFFRQRQILKASLQVHNIIVMKSELSPAGAQYTPLEKISLA